jgi:hypothetical protein
VAGLLVAIAAALVGGYAGIKLAGSSVQSIAAGSASVSVSADTAPGLIVSTSDPPSQLRYAAWSIPVAVNVAVRNVDPQVLLSAAVDQGDARNTLIHDARGAVGSAIAHIALAALLGALLCGLLAGALFALATTRLAALVGIALTATVLCGLLLGVTALQVTHNISSSLRTPSCQLPSVSAGQALQSATSGNLSTSVATSLAVRAACSPAFAGTLQSLGSRLGGR